MSGESFGRFAGGGLEMISEEGDGVPVDLQKLMLQHCLFLLK